MFLDSLRIRREIPSGEYVSHLPVVEALRAMDWFKFTASVTIFVGENGSGKSTLLEAIAVKLKLNREGGTKGEYFSTKDTTSKLSQYIELQKGHSFYDSYFFRAESFYNLASALDGSSYGFDAYGGRSLHHQSHGESFLSLIGNRLECGLYLFDEPESALSPMRQMSLLVEINRLIKSGSQLIIATHSPIIMGFPGAALYEFSQHGIFSTQWDCCEHVQVMKRFLSREIKCYSGFLSEKIKVF